MALRECGECGNAVSSWAKKCPHCGAPTPATQIATGIAGIGCLALLLIAVGLILVATGGC